jgi:hypothetical protein
MNRHLKSISLVLLIQLLVVPVLLMAIDDAYFNALQEQVKSVERKVASWERNANILLAIIVVVGLLGLVNTAIGSLGPKWTRAAVCVIGLTISGLMLIQEQVFPPGRKSYLAVGREGQKALRHVSISLQDLRNDKALDQDIQKRADYVKQNILDPLDKIQDLEDKLQVSETSMVRAQEREGQALQADGWSESNSLWLAQEHAYQDAVEKIARQLQGILGIPPGDPEMEALRYFVQSYGKKELSGPSSVDGGMYRFTVRLSIHPLLLRKMDVLRYVNEQKRATSPQYRLQGSARVPADLGGRDTATVAVTLRGNAQADGHFVVTLTFTKTGPQVRVVADRVETYGVGDPNSARWGFHLLVDNRLVTGLPPLRYDESGKPTRCLLDPAIGGVVSFQPASSVIDVRLLGYQASR